MEFLESLLAMVAPHSCIICNTEGQPLCTDCADRVAYKVPSCFSCNALSYGSKTCAKCRRKHSLSGVVVGYRYDGAIKNLIRALKYDHQVAAAKVLAERLTPLLRSEDFDIVTAIPGAPSRYRHRGYHQAELIAKPLARQLSLPYQPLLGRLEVSSQVGSSRRDRFARVKDSFYVRSPGLIDGQRILIVDDVLTTGATLDEAARVLKAAGTKSVWGAVAAKH